MYGNTAGGMDTAGAIIHVSVYTPVPICAHSTVVHSPSLITYYSSYSVLVVNFPALKCYLFTC